MSKWTDRIYFETHKSAAQGAAKTAKSTLLTATAAAHQGDCEKSATTFGSNGSMSHQYFEKIDKPKILQWLWHIGETDQDIMDEIIERCRIKKDACQYFLKRAEEVPKN